MKHAFLITAYDYPQQLSELIKSLYHEDHFFFIHIDKKSDAIIDSDYLKEIKTLPNVEILKERLKVNWGSFSHTKAILSLMQRAAQNKEIEYFHTLSGQDYPIKSLLFFSQFFDNAKINRKEFISFKPVPSPTWKGNGGLDRIQYYHLNEFFNPKIWWQQKTIRAIVLLQKNLFIKRPLPKECKQLYGGTVWCSLSCECVKYILDFLCENPKFLKRFEHTHCSEEILFQTIILNSPFAEYTENNNLRYFIMHKASPEVLDETNYKDIINSGKLFARKMSGKSKTLISMLKKYQHSEQILESQNSLQE